MMDCCPNCPSRCSLVAALAGIPVNLVAGDSGGWSVPDYRGDALVRGIHQGALPDQHSGIARLDLSLSGRAGTRSLVWTAEGRAEYDSLDNGGDSSRLRELGLEFRPARSFSLFAGKRYLVWARADELNPIDVINPGDQHRFLLEDRDDRKLGRVMLHAEFRRGDQALEIVHAPGNETHEFPDADNIWCGSTCRQFDPDYRNERLADQGLTPVRGEDEDERGDSALRYTTRVGTLDLGGLAYHGHSRFPVYGREFTGPSEVSIYRAHRRRPAFGLDGAWSTGPVSLRWEVVRVHGETFHLRPDVEGYADDEDGLVERDMTEAVVGIDGFGPWNVYINVQYFHRHIQGDEDRIIVPEGNRLATLQLDKTFHALEADVTWETTVDTEDTSFFHQLEAGYAPAHQWRVFSGAVYFQGKEETTFGQFHPNRGLYAGARYLF